MQYTQERRFLQSLCKGHIQDLLSDVGWTPVQCEIIKKRYLEFKSMARTSIEIGLSESQYLRQFNSICLKLRSYLAKNKDGEIEKIYQRFVG